MVHLMAIEPDVDAFLVKLNTKIREKKLSLLDADFLAAAEAGTLTRDQIEQWARVFYAATRNGRTILGTFYANSPDDPELRRELADNLYEEETGRLSGVNKCHMDVFFDLLAAFGIDEAEAASLTSPLGDYVAQGRPIAADDFYVELAAYGLSIEAPNAEFCQRIFDALSTNYDFTPQQLTWFSMHAELDADHGAEFQGHAAKAARAPDGLNRLRQHTLGMSEGAKLVWDGFGAWQVKAAAVD
jgi:pyrroloquinoline quinone (PQQ) biosynthesis protein C